MPADLRALPPVSVVIPAWNRRSSIRGAVDSILRQSFTDFELLVVDDGSTDGTMEALADLSDPRLRLLANARNMGASAARNIGIRAAQGIWIAFHDSDDEWLPQKLEKQMARLEIAGPNAVGCYCGMVTLWNLADMPTGVPLPAVGRRGVEYVPDPRILPVEGDIRSALLRANLASTQMLVARRDALLKIGGFDETLPALVDWDCVIRLAELGPFAFVDEPLVLQFFSENSITRSRRKRAEARAQIIRKHHAFFAADPKILAGHHVSIAGELRRLDDNAGARKAIGQAMRLRPFDPLILAKWLWLTVRSGLQRRPT